jgi:cell division protein DivIC
MKIIIPAYVNKYRFYFITGLIMLVWIIFFDEANIFSQFSLWRKLSGIRNQKEYYSEEIKNVDKERKEVMGNAKAMEQFAREKYLMKKPKETVFVLVDKEGKPIDEPSSK